jgi:hypothetical protein
MLGFERWGESRMKTDAPSPHHVLEDDKFTAFMRKLVSVPHSEIKARLEAEKAEKKKSILKPSKEQ